ncbi:glycosyltransferase [Salegentibacter sp. JZCK2]|uniref:glycosyltransferase family 2 protein n=1 Tax=Salegentibacter tibetensis TaxID=2873600 RepID=UPI001CCCF13F|nr:glycosyltransferase [Salegentibacter tibetensis]MBZ9729755.1 glycosyltransferase [Salegentibacter tibetensis]
MKNSLSIIYPYRNRELERVKRSLNSLQMQAVKNFTVLFVDYGSEPEKAIKAKELCSNFSFANYNYHPTRFQPWNKSRALNSVIKNLTSDFCFVADVDMIFHPDFVKNAVKLQQPETTVYFQVGFLSPEEGVEGKKYNEFTNYRNSTSEATGLSMFPVKVLQELRGFNEFYHFWGAEDTDMHIRLKNAGYPVEYYDKEILMLHQWHPSYRSKESKKLTENLQINGIVQLNHQHLKFTIENKIRETNIRKWGEIMSETDEIELENTSVNFRIQTEKRQVDDFLYGQLPALKNKVLKVVIEPDPFQNSKKFLAKKLFKKKVPVYYSLKEVNDLVLLHLISFYRDKAYIYKVESVKKQIILGIKL